MRVSETQLQERVHMIGKGRSKWKEKGGGVGIVVRHEAGLELEEMNVGTCEMSENIMAACMEYKCEGKVEWFVLCACYMTVEGTDAKEENRRKYEILRKLIEGNEREQIIIMDDINTHWNPGGRSKCEWSAGG